MASRGLFLVLEGLDGAGTTTQAQAVGAWLQAQGRRVRVDREPTDGPVGSLLRRALAGRLHLGGTRREAVHALLFAADRLDHAAHIESALAQGMDVVSDRYLPSSLSYQAAFLDAAWVRSLNREAPMPDLTVLLDLPVSVAWERIQGRGEAREHYEERRILASVAQGYRAWYEAARAEGEPVVRVDARLPIPAVTERIVRALRPLLAASSEPGAPGR